MSGKYDDILALLLTDQRAIPIPDILDVTIQKDALP